MDECCMNLPERSQALTALSGSYNHYGSSRNSGHDPANDVLPLWLRIPQAIRLSGVSRSKLYELIRENRIRSASLRDPGQTKATRLISRESLLAYIDSHATGGEA